MADFNPTPAQQNAIDESGRAILVSAGAGSGKTKVLTERLLKKITDPENPADIDSFLIITFTKAAAGELRSRIMEELAERLEKDPGNARLRRQSALCLRAQIGTIHSFCGNVIRSNSHVLGISPDFKVCDDDRAAQMKAAALERVLDDRYARIDSFPGFAELADTVGAGRDDSRLGVLVGQLHSKMQAHARPAKWAEDVINGLDADFGDASESVWGRYLMDRAAAAADYWSAEFESILAGLEENPDVKSKYGESFAKTHDCLRRLRISLNGSWDSVCDAFPVEFPKLNRAKKTDYTEELQAKRKNCKKAMDKLEPGFRARSAELAAQMKKTAPAMKALLALTLDFDARYAADKRRAGLLDYSDLEHFAVALLTDENSRPTDIARDLSAGFTEVMVDEFQDISRVQEAVFSAVSDNRRKLFMVGDVKQSIYRFRLADPEIFNEKYLSYDDVGAPHKSEGTRIMLRKNFRSRREILNAANAVFSLCMTREMGDVDYDDKAALVYGAINYEGDVPVPELVMIEPGGLQLDDDGGESPSNQAVEAEYVAARIRELIESGMTVGSGDKKKPLEYGDIAVLHRSANKAGAAFRKAFAAHGIPVAGSDGSDFFSAQETALLMAILTVADNPHRDIPLLHVLRSPVFRFTPDELAQIRGSDRHSDIFGALTRAAKNNAHCAETLETLNSLRSAAPDMTPAELVWHIISSLDLTAICSAMSEGEHRRANLMAFVSLAESFQATGYHGLHRFLLWLKRKAVSGKNAPVEAAQSASAVQILSIHKSKGLEFPVVFLCGCSNRFNKRDSADTVIVHDELGLGPKVTDTVRHIEYPTLARRAIAAKLNHETVSEELRLLYVAMTRTKERLIITAVANKAEEKIAASRSAIGDSAAGVLSPELSAAASSYMDWLLYAAAADGGEHIELKLVSPGSSAVEPAADGGQQEPGECSAELISRLEFEYPHAAAEGLPSKVTATELKGHDADGDTENASVAPKHQRRFRMPDFVRLNKPASGTEKGIAAHLVLQYIDMSACVSLEAVKHEIQRLHAGDYISAREAECVEPEAVWRLFESETGKRMLASAGSMRREFKFSLLVDAGDVYGIAEDEKLLLQGVVDCCIEEDDGLVIIDYKTDAVKTAADMDERTALYRGQVLTYARAMQRITGKRVKECVLFYLRTGEARNIAIEL